MPFFSIVIPTYNRLEILKETLASLDSQIEKDFETIIIDDGSTDGTTEYLTTLEEKIKFISLKNSGPGAARNAGIEIAQGEYIAFLDSDDLLFPRSLAIYKNVIQTSSSKVLFGKPARFRHLKELQKTAQETLQIETFEDYYSSGDQWRWWGVSSFVIQKALLKKTKFLTKPINAEDADLLMKLGTAGPLTQIQSPSTFAYREHAESVMSNWDKSWKGILHLISQEQSGKYPGGKNRHSERIKILLRHIKPELLSATYRNEKKSDTLRTFMKISPWLIKQRQWKFIVGFIITFLKMKSP